MTAEQKKIDVNLLADALLRERGWEPRNLEISGGLLKTSQSYLNAHYHLMMHILESNQSHRICVSIEPFAMSHRDKDELENYRNAQHHKLARYKESEFLEVDVPDGLSSILDTLAYLYRDDEAEKTLSNPTISSTSKERLTIQRVGQALFRDKLLKEWGGKCCITGLSRPDLLRASHIVGWAEDSCTDAMRLDPNNGLLLIPNLDAAFDQHLISFGQDGALLISDARKSELSSFLCGAERSSISQNHLTERRRKYLLHHQALWSQGLTGHEQDQNREDNQKDVLKRR